MKILLTHGYFLYEDEKEQQIMKPYPPLGLQYLSAYLESHGYENDIFDTTFSSFRDLEACLLEQQPDLLGIYVNLMTKQQVLDIIRFIKGQPALSRTRIVLGGPEVRHHRNQFLNFGADIVVFGEGEATMLEVAQQYREHSHPNLSKIPGIAYRSADGTPQVNPDRPLIQDIDTLQLPNRHKIDLQKYLDAWRQHHGYSMISLSTMRGCPYGCRWCSRAVYGKTYRRRSPEKVAEEIELLQQQYDFDKIWFVDDVFTINHRWLRAFAEALEAKNLSISYEAISRADRMNEEVVQLLQRTGCFRIWIGAESGSQKILDAMNRMVKIEKVKEMVQCSKRYGIETGTFLMLGYPGETQQDIRQTLEYLLEADPDHYTITVAYPIKGTPFYGEVEGQFANHLDWESSSDRDIEFRRTYPRAYYDHAMRWIKYEVDYHRRKKYEGWVPGLLPTKLRSAKAQLGMALYRSTDRGAQIIEQASTWNLSRIVKR